MFISGNRPKEGVRTDSAAPQHRCHSREYRHQGEKHNTCREILATFSEQMRWRIFFILFHFVYCENYDFSPRNTRLPRNGPMPAPVSCSKAPKCSPQRTCNWSGKIPTSRASLPSCVERRASSMQQSYASFS